MTAFAKTQLKSIVERIERLDEESKALSDDKADIYREAKSNGFDTKALKEVIRQRRKDPAERAELESLVDIYKHALGMDGTDDAPTRARVSVVEVLPTSPTDDLEIPASLRRTA